MRRFLIVVVVSLLAPAALAAGSVAEVAMPVVLKSHVVVDGPMVLLGDLFEGAGAQADTAIARAPAPGKQVEVGARWLAAVAQAYGLAWRPSSPLERTMVERASTAIDTRRIEGELIDALARRGVTGRISLVLDQPGLQLNLPMDAEPTMAIAGLTHDPTSGRFTAIVLAPATGTPLAKATISGRAVTMTDVPVLRRRIEPGEVIRADDIEWTSARTDRLGRDVIVDAQDLVGKSPRRPMRPGDPLMGSELRAPVMVAKNSLITIRLETPRLSLTAQGRALEPGAAGDAIRVVNTKSNKIINATVIDSSTVSVESVTLTSAIE